MSWSQRAVILALAAVLACLVGVGRASAVHNTGLFELDGDAFNDPAVAGDDWSTVNLGLPGGYFSRVLVPQSVEGPGADTSYFTGGGSKDTNDLNQWQWSAGDVAPDKDEFTNAYAASYADASGHTIVNFGADRFDTNGDANVGFWFFQNQVSLNANGTFSGVHSNGDVFVVSAFTQGGSAPTVAVYEWQSGALVPISSGVTCTPTDSACAFVNASSIPVTWYYQDKSGDPVGTVPAGGFFEGGIDLTSLFAGGQVPCFSNFVAETRSSQSPTAQLKDLAMGSIDSCGSITIHKSATPKSSQSFSFSASGADAKVGPFSLVDSGSGTSNTKLFESIQPGSYSFGENALPSDWDFDHISCTTTGAGTTTSTSGTALSVTLKPGGSADCTYFNVRKPTLTVTKTLVPANDAGTFGLQIDGTTKATGGNGTTTGAVIVSAGAHAVAEVGANGTSLGDYTSVYGGDCDANGNVTVSAGQNKACTITNTRIPTLTVKKVLLPSSDQGTFGLQIDGQTKATGGDGTSTGATAVSIGAHSVAEVSANGTDLSRYTSAIGGDCAADGSVSLAAGENKVCTITNTRIPTLTVKKVLVPANDPGTFGLQIDGQTKASGGNGTTTGAVAVSLGAHSVAEVSANGTDLTNYVSAVSGDCAADGSVSLAAGENKVCTITNTRKPRLIVIKKVVNDDGGTAVASDFTLAVNGTSPTPASFNGAAAPGVEVTLGAGSYSVSETGGPSGYAGSLSADCTGTIALGETKTCTVTNDDKPAKLTVIKKVVNDDGGTADAGDFTMNVTANQPSQASFQGDATGTTVTVKPGAYSVSESGGPAGYTGSSSADCAGTIAIGESKTCTITNDDNPATLTVIKKVVNDDGGTAVAGDFTMSVTGTQPSPASFAGDSAGTKVSIKPGSYSVSEGGPAGYAGTFSADCTGSIALGESKTCTVTNDDKPAKLIVIKKVINDDGGTAVAGDFTMNVTASQPSQASFAGDANGTTVSVHPGAYSVSESGGPAGYTGSSSADCAGTIALGETKTCTITNDDNPATLTVIKKVVNDDGGTAVAGDFTMSVTGTQPSPASFNGDSNGTKVSIKPGSYSVSEGGPAGYAGSFSADCSGTIALGETKTCTVTNDDKPATLTVIKKVVNDDGGTAVAGDFTMNVTANQPSKASFAGDANGTVVTVKAGAYSVSESGGPSGYAGSSSADCAGTIAIGESKTCTITNDDKPAKLTVIKKVVNDDGGTAVSSDFTLGVTGGQPSPASFKGDANGTVVTLKAGAYTVSETGGPSGYAGTLSADCDGTIAIGESKTCTVTNDDKPAKLTVIKKVVNNDGGTAVSSDFTLGVTGGQPSPASFKGDANGTVVTLRPGTYAVSETGGPSGYAGTFSTDCSGSIALGESKTCTVTNDDQATPPPPVPPTPPAPPVTPTPPAPKIDLAITKRDAPDPATVGQHLTYTLTVRNNGPDTATGVVVDDPLPTTVGFVSVKTTVGTCLGGAEIRCQLGTMANGAVVVITITVTPRQTGVIFNKATVVGNEPETNTANNTDTAQTLVKGPFVPKVVRHGCIDIEITTRSTTVGKHSRLTIHVTELGKAAAGIRVRVHGAGVDRISPRSDRHGVIRMTITPRKAGIIRITTPSRASCGTPRIGVVGAFTPPVTG